MTINLGKRVLDYELHRKPVKHINLRIRSDGSVFVSANNDIPQEEIENFLIKKSETIFDAIERYSKISKYSADDYSYITGESFRYLGKDLRLKVNVGKRKVDTDGVYLYLILPDISDKEMKVQLISKWYDKECRTLFPAITRDIYNKLFQKYDIVLPSLIIRNMTSRWGSCQIKRNTITLNRRLIETPRECIEYVVVHEFTHFLQPNHSRKFYDLLAVFMPDWEERKNTLEGFMFQGI